MDNSKEYENLEKFNELLHQLNKNLDALIECNEMKNQSNVQNIEQLQANMDVHIGIHMNTLKYISKEIKKNRYEKL